MNLRHKLANWISGGSYDAALRSADMWRRCLAEARIAQVKQYAALRDIHDYVSPQKSGTSAKVARMAKDALDL